MEVIATVLAQSVAIDYYDEDAQAILDRLATLARGVAQKGRPLGRQRDLLRFAGASMAFQAEIIRAILLLDKPDLTWEDELADRVHEKLRYHFEIAERYRALEAKLRTIRETLQMLIELTSERRMFLVEVAVLSLIRDRGRSRAPAGSTNHSIHGEQSGALLRRPWLDSGLPHLLRERALGWPEPDACPRGYAEATVGCDAAGWPKRSRRGQAAPGRLGGTLGLGNSETVAATTAR